MQLSKYVKDKIIECDLPQVFHFKHKDGVIVDIEETEELKGDLLLASLDKSDAFAILESHMEEIDWFVFVDDKFNVQVLGEPEDEQSLEGIFDELYKKSGFEKREEQVKMAKLILRAFEESKNAIVEAPTGTGKSLAYLVPSILFSKKHNKRVVVSTNTKNLQQQLLKKDLPALESLVKFKAAIAFGRNNYICKRKAENVISRGDVFLFESDIYSEIKEFLLSTDTGLKSEFFSKDNGLDESVWSMFESDSLSCAHKRCPYYKGQCFFYRARKQLDLAKLIIANHHLVLSHSVMENADILPEFGCLVVDEAHNVEKNATSYYTNTVTTTDIIKLLDMLFTSKKGKERGLLAAYDEPDLKGKIVDTKRNLEVIFDELMELLKENETVINSRNLDRFTDTFNEMIDIISNMQLSFKRFISGLEETEAIDLKAVYSKLESILNLISSFREIESDSQVYWLRKFKKSIHFNITPVDVREALRHYIFENIDSVVFTSATLSVNGSFDFFRRSLGIDDALEFSAKGNFDYKENSRLFLVYDMPTPDDSRFAKNASDVLVSISKPLKNSNRGALILFTSYKLLNEVYELSHEELDKIGFNVLRQGMFDNFELLRKFKKGKTFLFATSSFWEGVDVKGDELSVVVVVKLPFEVPTTAVERVRYELMKSEGVNPFLEYSLPKAVLRLKQGLGRLLRQKTDRGVMVVLDSRIVTKSYGKVFLKSLDYMKQERISKNEVEKCVSDFFSYPNK